MMLSVSLRLTGSQNSFNVFQIELLGGHLYNNYSLTSDLLFYSIPFYIDIRILIESATVAITIFNDYTTAWLTCHFLSITISKLLDVSERIQFKVCIRLYKCLHGKSPKMMDSRCVQRLENNLM